jgi:hypothetical protein
VIRRGEVWISLEGWVPPGRMIDPDTADFGASWQDDGSLEDEVLHGAAAAVEWGRERSDVVMIRLVHHEGSYFSAGERHLADVPHWPPPGAPPEGWWTPPPIPTLEDVTAKVESVQRGETDPAEARSWAKEQLAIFLPELGESHLPTLRALWELSEDGKRPPRHTTVVRQKDSPA